MSSIMMALRQWPELQLDQNQKPQFVQLDEDDSPRVPRRPPMLQLFTFPFSAMASPCAVHLYGDDRAGVEAIAEAAITEVARIGQRYSRYRSDGALAEINDVARRAGSIVVDWPDGFFVPTGERLLHRLVRDRSPLPHASSRSCAARLRVVRPGISPQKPPPAPG